MAMQTIVRLVTLALASLIACWQSLLPSSLISSSAFCLAANAAPGNSHGTTRNGDFRKGAHQSKLRRKKSGEGGFLISRVSSSSLNLCVGWREQHTDQRSDKHRDQQQQHHQAPSHQHSQQLWTEASDVAHVEPSRIVASATAAVTAGRRASYKISGISPTIATTAEAGGVINGTADGAYAVSKRAARTASARQKALEMEARFPNVRSKIPNTFPPVRNLYDRISFGWVRDLMRRGNEVPLELTDVFLLPPHQQMAHTAEEFEAYFSEERSRSRAANYSVARYETEKVNILVEFWKSPLTRAIVRMYRKEFLLSGVTKFFNTLSQFLPSLIVSRILAYVDGAKQAQGALNSADSVWQLLLQKRMGLQLSVLLLACLSLKTIIENQYFDRVSRFSAEIRGAISTAIYRKSLRLSPQSRKNNTLGEIVNYMQLDTGRIEYVAGSIHTVWDGLLQITGYTALLLHFLGPSVLAGIAAMLVIIPLNAHFLIELSRMREINLKYTDRRVKLTNEILQGIGAIKSYNWEKPFVKELQELRNEEMICLKKAANIRAVLTSVLSTAPSIVAVITLSCYALLGNDLSPTKVFTSLALFNQLRFPLIFFPLLMNSLAEGKVSLKRITRFLLTDEVEGYVDHSDAVDAAEGNDNAVEVVDGNFSWGDEPANEKQKQQQQQQQRKAEASTRDQLVDVNLNIRKGELVAVVGPTGSGKSTLLQALLGELHYDASPTSRVAVKGRVAYVPQSSWIPNDSLRNVVLFGNDFDQKKYDKVISVCGLRRDLQLLEAGDETEIGERGVNLSGGQKQRVSIARATYDDADVYLFDDPLSALDAEVGAAVFSQCIKKALKGKTRVLVTHQLGVLPEVDRIILMAEPVDGAASTILDQGSWDELTARGHDLTRFVQQNSELVEEMVQAATAAASAASTGAATGAGTVETAPELQTDSKALNDVASAGSSAIAPSEQGGEESELVDVDIVDSGLRGVDVAANITVDHRHFVMESVPPSGALIDCCTSLGLEDCSHESCMRYLRENSLLSDVEDEKTQLQLMLERKELLAESDVGKSVAATPDIVRIKTVSTQHNPQQQEQQQHDLHELQKHDQFNGHATSAGKDVSTTSSHRTDTDTGLKSTRNGSVSDSSAAAALKVSPAVKSVGGGAKKLMTKEERAQGAVGWNVYKAYFSAMNKPVLMALVVVSFLMVNVSQIGQQWVVAAWTSDAGYVKRPLAAYLAAVAGMAGFVALFNWMRVYIGVLVGAVASRKIHNEMISTVLGAPMSFFESTPVGRLVQRFSKDLDQIDQQLPTSLGMLISNTLNIMGSMLAITIVTPSFSLVMAVLFTFYIRATNYYRAVARELKRLEAISRSPIYSHFSETLGGLPVIRSFKRQALFRRNNEVRLDDNISTFATLKSIDRWLSMRLEFLGNTIVFFSATLAVLTGSRAGSAGLSLNNALGVTSLLNWAVRNAAEVESLMSSVERVQYTIKATPQEVSPEVDFIDRDAYYNVQQENILFMQQSAAEDRSQATGGSSDANGAATEVPFPRSDEELLRSGWPWAGGVMFSDVHMRYREDFAPVLKGLDLTIQPGERVGIVGRTGSGKSSIFRCLMRLNEIESGKIYMDGVDISAVGLGTLRSSISVIPQDPVLFSGSIRMNLDPFNRHTDEELWSALLKSKLYNTVSSLHGCLDYEVSEGGENFSSGQRQLLCLARALVRRSRILLLDEATSSVDFETDALIQETIRKEFGGGQTTVVTIAHRLDTIMDADRILVMDAGRVGEYDSPEKLLADPHSLFSQLVAAEQLQQQQ